MLIHPAIDIRTLYWLWLVHLQLLERSTQMPDLLESICLEMIYEIRKGYDCTIQTTK